MPLALVPDIVAVQWGKLLINLNNPVNALSRLSLRDEFLHAGWRRSFAALVEGLAVLAAAGIRLRRLPQARLVRVLRLPNWLFRLVTRGAC